MILAKQWDQFVGSITTKKLNHSFIEIEDTDTLFLLNFRNDADILT